jgi:pimeloyl-ACP methyl ester carboxylesterase
MLLRPGDDERAMTCFVDFWNGIGTWNSKPTPERDQLAPLARKVINDFRILFEAKWKAHDFGVWRTPTLILKGDISPPVTQRIAESLARLIPQAQLLTIQNVGHMAPVTHPHLVAPIIMEHLASWPMLEFRITRSKSVH